MFPDHDAFHHGPGLYGLVLFGAFVAVAVIGLIALFEKPRVRVRPAQVPLFLGLAMGGGLAFGVLDRVLSLGPTWALDLSNVGALWLVAAFVAGAMTRSRPLGAVLGWLCLLAALAGYYGYLGLVEHGGPIRYIEHRAAPWIVVTCVVGPLFGALGADWRNRRSWTAGIVLASAIFADGAMFLLLAGDMGRHDEFVHGAVMIAGTAVALAVVLAHHRASAGTRPERA